jgi:hypothetical protein
LNTPLKIAKAIRSDYVRVVYFDGQIYDYKIELWPSSSPLGDPKKMPAANSPGRISPADRLREKRAEEKCRRGENSFFSYDTGYWGSTVTQDSANPNIIVHAVNWVFTGTVVVRDYQDCRGK